ncbi:MAG: c-type cytochrome [Elusimicrobia bacterium]|nr:c-type cytochrome [Elusimicrobiota bacterium]
MKRLIQSVMVLAVLAGMGGVAFAEDAAKIYSSKCAMCHGKDAKGNPGMAKSLGAEKLNLLDAATQAKTDADLIKATAEGAGTPKASGAKPMPAFKGKVADVDIKALVAYVRSLAPKK